MPLVRCLKWGAWGTLTPTQQEERLLLCQKARKIPGIGRRAVANVIDVPYARIQRYENGEISKTKKNSIPRLSIEQQKMTIRIKLGNELKKSLGHGKLSSLTPEQLHERITLGLKARDIPGVGVRAVSDVIGVSKSALSRHGRGEISPQRIGSKGKPPRIDPAAEKYFLKAISMGSARGSNAISRDMLPGLIQDFSESLGTTTYCVAPTDNSRMERMRVRHPDTPPKAVKPKVKSKVKAASSNPAVVKAMFSFW